MTAAPTNLVAILNHAASTNPDGIAIEDEFGHALTYREFEDATKRMAACLRAKGVKAGDRVGVSMPKSINSVISIMGALRAGACYVPADYGAPRERNRYIFENCECAVVCVDEPRQERFYGEGDPQTLLVFPGESTAGVGAPWLDDAAPLEDATEPGPDDAAYILYTSGSTGLPKGVFHTHESAVSFVNWCNEVFEPTPSDRFSSHAPFHFDLSILDLYVPQTAGAAIVIVSDALAKEPHRLAPFIAEKKLTVWYSVPSILALMAQFGQLETHDCPSLRTVLFAGEVFPVKHLRSLTEFWPAPDYYNLYGPTETNVCTYYKIPDTIDPDRTTPYPIGPPCENCLAIILDEDMNEVGAGEEGVLYMHQSGPVMKEYWANPELTEAAFYTDDEGRWYCTGDVVVDSDDGLIFVGRRDRMVKRHGYRIELGEIEAGLYRHESIEEAAALAIASDEGVTVVAYLSSKDGEKLSIIALKQFCNQNLPSYMSPDKFVFLDALPRTSTDKVDYQALKARDGA